jgi:hypothetical protein
MIPDSFMRSEVLQRFPDMSLCLFRRACTFDGRPISRPGACNPCLDENYTAIHGNFFWHGRRKSTRKRGSGALVGAVDMALRLTCATVRGQLSRLIMSRNHELPNKCSLFELVRRNVHWFYVSPHTQVASRKIALSRPSDNSRRDLYCAVSK